MKRLFLIMLLAGFLKPALAQDIIILHTNDLHSKLNGYSPELEYTPKTTSDDLTRGGFARIAAYIQKTKLDNPTDIVLAVDGGDFLMGSLFHPLERESGFQLKLMHQMGYDYLAIGNHEFDYGPEMLAQIINLARDEHEIPQLLLSNVEFDKKDSRDDALEALFDKGIIKNVTIHEEKGVKIALLGIFGIDAMEVQPLLPPVEITNQIKTVKKTAKELIKSEKADIVIVLSHSGVEKEDGEWTGEDVKLAKKSAPYIHAIISGHTHTKLDEPIIESEIPVVQAGSGGLNIGKLHLRKTNGEYAMLSHELIPVDDEIQANMSIQKKIDEQKEIVQSELLDPLDIQYDDPIFETAFNMECHEDGELGKSTLGPLLADAIQGYVTDNGIHSDMSLIAAGVIRDQLRTGKHGKQNVSDIFRIVSLGEGNDAHPGYPLAQVFVTAKELKSVIEVLLMTQSSTPAAYCYYGGIRINADMSKGFLKKVQQIELRNEKNEWVLLDISRKNENLYSVTANSYMLTFLSMIKKKSFGIVNVKPKDVNGIPIVKMETQYLDFDPNKPGAQEGKEWQAFLHYVSKFPDTNDNGIPDMPKERKHTYNPVIYLEK
ncbi:MAG: 5'-nucleotidase C-terminal domain-containing protein [Bacteroidales bacterium]|jgi:5'-nucleotidase/UDP-sugar diphosphatase|nr:5'-nucleotidase C-terminal domain-containing protein [Bacteroidales bacterium]